jgi:hypothetical protein
MNAESESHVVKKETGFYEAYKAFTTSLRTWFVAFGIGGPVLFITNDDARKVLVDSGEAMTIGLLFLVGVGLQIIEALLYKNAMWHLYVGEVYPTRRSGPLYEFSDWVSECYPLGLMFDIATLGVFGSATVKVILVFAR